VLHLNRSRAESFGTDANLYDRARPSYPSALVDALLVDGAGSVLDVGCGTGIAAALLAARGCAVLGIEVDRRMAEVARGKGLAVEVAAFERWKRAGRRFDLVVSGQAWHWIDPRAGAAKAAATLNRNGRIGLFWNFGDPPLHVRERLAPAYARLAPGLESYALRLTNRHARVEEALAGIAAAGQFAAAETSTFGWDQTRDAAGWVDHLSTQSDHWALPPAQRERLLAAVAEAIDAIGGSFEMGYETVLVSARKA
jgi:SAM-dependent methyltransferase